MLLVIIRPIFPLRVLEFSWLLGGPVSLSGRPEFVRRSNRDRTIDSVCTRCLATVASSESKAALDRAEMAHVCDTVNLERWKNLSEGRVNRPR